MLGLKAARATNDLDALRWVSLGVLNQAWTKEQARVWQAGMGVAQEVYDRLKAENRGKEAESFKAELDQAIERGNVIVDIIYTGDADVDLSVQEPGGTVCWWRDPRSTAGGVFVGDMDGLLSQSLLDNGGGHSQVYVCPRGFDGTYRVVLDPIWGKVTTGKVTVEVVTHYGSKDRVAACDKIALDKEKVAVVFDLENGRRKESLRERQVASTAQGQLAVGNVQLLARQVAASVDPRTMANAAVARNVMGNNGTSEGDLLAGGFAGLFNNPFFGARGAVGYQPVIELLPGAAQFGVQAVVSADRRYVGVSAQPFFSGIAKSARSILLTGTRAPARAERADKATAVCLAAAPAAAAPAAAAAAFFKPPKQNKLIDQETGISACLFQTDEKCLSSSKNFLFQCAPPRPDRRRGRGSRSARL